MEVNRVENSNTSSKTKVLLLGVGYLGSELLKYLSRKYKVITIDHGRYYSKLRNVQGINFKNVRFYKGDVLNDGLLEKCMSKVDVVINLLGGGGNQASLKDPSWAINTYIIGNQKIIEKAKRYHIKHLILSSSIAVYPKGKKGSLTESTILAPDNVYGFFKLASEKILQNSNVNFTILRLANLYGFNEINPIQKGGALGNFIKAALDGKDLLIRGNGNQKIDYVHIKDVCECIMLLLEKDFKRREIYNIGSGSLKTVNKIAKTVLSLVKKYSSIKKEIRIKKMPFNNIQDYGLMSIKKIKKEMGWNPNVEFNQGIEEMIIKCSRKYSRLKNFRPI